MTQLARVRVALTGTPIVGPGVSTFYFDSAGAGFTAALNAFFADMPGRFPLGLSLFIPNTGDLVDSATGAITGTWTDGTVHTVNGSGGTAYMKGVGARIVWGTAGRTNGRPVHGTTFLVPLTSSQFTTSGVMDSAAATAIKSAGETLITAATSGMRVWTRPRAGVGGVAHSITSVRVPLEPSWLRSRKS